MGARREQRSKRERETDSAYQPSLHLLLLPSLSEHFFLTGYNHCSPLIYHTKELNVDTSKYFHTHGSLGHVFSPCLKWNGPIHHWLFATETETMRSICVYACLCERTGVYLSSYAPWMTVLRCKKCLSNTLVYAEQAMHWFYEQRSETIGTVTNVGSHNKVVLADCQPLLMHVDQ